MLGRMRLDGLTETAVPFAERAVLLWRRGAPTPDMDVDVLMELLMVCLVSPCVLSRCVRCSVSVVQGSVKCKGQQISAEA